MSNGSNEQWGPQWLVLVYRFGAVEQGRFRGAAWRRLRALGAVYLQGGVAVLPASAHSERSLRKLRHDIVERSGSAVLLDCKVLAGERAVVAAFKAASDDEYGELVDRCQEFLDKLLSEHRDQRYTLAALQGSEANLTKLGNQLAKVTERDAFGAEGRGPAEKALRECARTLDAYEAMVNEKETDDDGLSQRGRPRPRPLGKATRSLALGIRPGELDTTFRMKSSLAWDNWACLRSCPPRAESTLEVKNSARAARATVSPNGRPGPGARTSFQIALFAQQRGWLPLSQGADPAATSVPATRPPGNSRGARRGSRYDAFAPGRAGSGRLTGRRGRPNA